MIDPKTPMAAASVGVVMPPIIDPRTITTITIGKMTAFRAANLRVQLPRSDLGIAGPRWG